MPLAGLAWFLPRVWGPDTGPRGRARGGGRQNNRAFFLSSFLFQRARRSNSSTSIPNTSWNSSGDRCLFEQKGKSQRGAVSSFATHAREAGPAAGRTGPPVPPHSLRVPVPPTVRLTGPSPGERGPRRRLRTRLPLQPEARGARPGRGLRPPGGARARGRCATCAHAIDFTARSRRRRRCARHTDGRGSRGAEREPGGPRPTPRPAPPAPAVRSAASALPGPRSPSLGTRRGCTAWGQGHRPQSLWDAG